jgi:hypothetical protein
MSRAVLSCQKRLYKYCTYGLVKKDFTFTIDLHVVTRGEMSNKNN